LGVGREKARDRGRSETNCDHNSDPERLNVPRLEVEADKNRGESEANCAKESDEEEDR
jgi:hypothetical protein